jgi:hypothetical protein
MPWSHDTSAHSLLPSSYSQELSRATSIQTRLGWPFAKRERAIARSSGEQCHSASLVEELAVEVDVLLCVDISRHGGCMAITRSLSERRSPRSSDEHVSLSSAAGQHPCPSCLAPVRWLWQLDTFFPQPTVSMRAKNGSEAIASCSGIKPKSNSSNEH